MERFLQSRGTTIRETEWLGDGYDGVELSLNIATRGQIGGDEEEGIEWVILSTLFA